MNLLLKCRLACLGLLSIWISSLSLHAGLVEFGGRGIVYGPAGSQAPADPEVVKLLEGAAKKHAAGDPDGCVALLRKAHLKDRTLLPAEIAYARLLAVVEDYPGAQARLQNLPRELRQHPDALALAAEIAFTQGRRFDAEGQLARLDDILKTNPRTPSAAEYRHLVHRGRMMIAAADQEWDAVTREARWLEGKVPGDVEALRHLARATFETDGAEAARPWLERVVQFDPKAEDPGLVLHRLHAGKGEWQQAEAELLQAAEKYLDDGILQLRLASWLLAVDKVEAAGEAIEAADSAGANEQVVALTQGLQLWRSGKLAEAVVHFDQVLEQYPQNSQLRRWAALLTAESANGNADTIRRALELAEGELKVSGGGAGALAVAGWVDFHEGTVGDAEKLLRESWTRKPGDPQTAYFLATLFAKSGREADARELLAPFIKSGQPFLYRREAEALFVSLPED